MNPTTSMVGPPSHICADPKSNESLLSSRMGAEDGASALAEHKPAGHAIPPRPAWVRGRLAAFPTPTS